MRAPKSVRGYAVLALVIVVAAVIGFFVAEGSLSESGSATQRAGAVPAAATQTLAEIDAGTWPESANAPGTKGGQTWQNRERNLPATDDAGAPIKYREWDVNPKKQGQSRDAERIVTGSDGSAWYTDDHYETFTRMR